jgi:hypothetical protein
MLVDQDLRIHKQIKTTYTDWRHAIYFQSFAFAIDQGELLDMLLAVVCTSDCPEGTEWGSVESEVYTTWMK